MAGMWELPQGMRTVPGSNHTSSAAAKRRKITAHGASRGFPAKNEEARNRRKNGLDSPWRIFRHSITVTDYTVHVTRAPAPAAKGKWIAIEKISDVPITGLTRKILKAAGII